MILSVSVLKDQVLLLLYELESNGVIVIKTKDGSKKRFSVGLIPL
jgi:hypothetical protein